MWQKRPKKSKKQKRTGWASKSKSLFEDDTTGDFADSGELEDSAGPSGTDLLDNEEDEPITFDIVYERAMRLLVRREHGKKELELKLIQRELPLDLITSVLDNLAEEGLQCDVRFAEAYTRMRISRGNGANKIRADLQNRQLDSSIIEDAISTNEVDWSELAFEALGKKFGRVGGVKMDFETRAKLQRYLYQRGFETAEMQAAIKKFESASSQFENDLLL